MTKRIGGLVFTLLLSLLSVHNAAAQENDSQPAIQQMRVQILPEYDDPRVLVVAQGRLDVPSGIYNGPITFRIPAGAQINQMAVMDLELGGPQFQDYDSEIDPLNPAWQLVTYTLNNPHFFYEYYYDLPGSGSQKQFTFSLNSLEAIEVLTMEVQQPLKAESFSLEPEAATSREDTAGFTYWQLPDRAVAEGEAVEVLVRYTKSDPNPSVARQTGVAGETADSNPTISTVEADPVSNSWIGLTIIGVAFVIGLGFMRYRIRPKQEPVPRTRSAAAVPATPDITVSPQEIEPTSLSPSQSTQPQFCTQCGQSLSPNARFCPYCGEGVKNR